MAGQLLFAFLFTGVFLCFSIRQHRVPNLRSFPLFAALLLFAGFALRIAMGLTAQGFETDMSTFKSWASLANESGMQNIYYQDVFIDYPPGYLYVLMGLEKLRLLWDLPGESAVFTLMIKLPSILGDMFCAAMLLYVGNKHRGPGTALFLSAAYLFCPAVLINSAVWGQADSFCLSILLVSLLLLYKGRYFPAAAFFGLSIICKPQMLIFIPLFLFFALKEKKWKELVLCPLLAFGVMLLAALPFTRNFDFFWLLDTYKDSMKGYQYFTVNAYNIWGLIGKNWIALPQEGSVPSYLLHWAGPLLATGWCGWLMLRSKRRDAIFACGTVLMTVVYLFTVKMHERYLFHVLLLILLTCVFCRDYRLRIGFGAVSLAHFVNVTYVLNLFNTVGHQYDPNEVMVKLLSALQILACGYLLYIVTRIYVLEEILLPQPVKDNGVLKQTSSAPILAVPKLCRLDLFLMAAIAGLYALVAFWQLGSHETAVTPWTPQAGESVVLKAQEPGTSLTYIPGIAPSANGTGARTGTSVQISYSADGLTWQEAGNLNDAYVFAWTRQELGAQATYIRLIALDNAVCLNEIALTNGANTAPVPLSLVSGAGEALVDEQAVVPVTITYYHSMYFDEIYHARTAYETLQGLEPYENTHPPLGKLIISLGISLFGMNPFGWRFMGTLFGVLMLPVLYHLLKQLLGNSFLSAAGTLLFALDFMHFTQTRIATIDTYAVFFILLMFDAMVIFVKKDFSGEPVKNLLPPLLASGIFMGIGCASKWTVFYGAAGLAVLLFAKLIYSCLVQKTIQERLQLFNKALLVCLWCCLFFVLIPFGIYFAAFLPYTGMTGKSVLPAFVNYQSTMYNYHSGLVAEHGFSSPWYEWPLIIKPIWFYYTKDLPASGSISTISSFGNPALWWPAIPAMLYTLYAAVRKRLLAPVTAAVGFLSVYLPWVLVPRLTFIYHYFTAVPFLILALMYCLQILQNKHSPRQKLLSIPLGNTGTAVKLSSFHLAVLLFVLLNLILFLAFFPVLSGAETTKVYGDSLEWFSGWYFA